MRARVQKWGNSAAIRLPVAALESANLSVDQVVEINSEDGALVIRPVDVLPSYSLNELLAGITPENRNVDQSWADEGPVGREAL